MNKVSAFLHVFNRLMCMFSRQSETILLVNSIGITQHLVTLNILARAAFATCLALNIHYLSFPDCYNRVLGSY